MSDRFPIGSYLSSSGVNHHFVVNVQLKSFVVTEQPVHGSQVGCAGVWCPRCPLELRKVRKYQRWTRKVELVIRTVVEGPVAPEKIRSTRRGLSAKSRQGRGYRDGRDPGR